VTYVVTQQKKIELRASLIQELEHKKKVIENERNTMELTGGKVMLRNVPLCCSDHTSFRAISRLTVMNIF